MAAVDWSRRSRQMECSIFTPCWCFQVTGYCRDGSLVCREVPRETLPKLGGDNKHSHGKHISFFPVARQIENPSSCIFFYFHWFCCDFQCDSGGLASSLACPECSLSSVSARDSQVHVFMGLMGKQEFLEH